MSPRSDLSSPASCAASVACAARARGRQVARQRLDGARLRLGEVTRVRRSVAQLPPQRRDVLRGGGAGGVRLEQLLGKPLDGGALPRDGLTRHVQLRRQRVAARAGRRQLARQRHDARLRGGGLVLRRLARRGGGASATSAACAARNMSARYATRVASSSRCTASMSAAAAEACAWETWQGTE